MIICIKQVKFLKVKLVHFCGTFVLSSENSTTTQSNVYAWNSYFYICILFGRRQQISKQILLVQFVCRKLIHF